jgi:hypothetical protein
MSFYPAALAAAPKSPSGDGFSRVLAGAFRVPGHGIKPGYGIKPARL